MHFEMHLRGLTTHLASLLVFFFVGHQLQAPGWPSPANGAHKFALVCRFDREVLIKDGKTLPNHLITEQISGLKSRHFCLLQIDVMRKKKEGETRNRYANRVREPRNTSRLRPPKSITPILSPLTWMPFLSLISIPCKLRAPPSRSSRLPCLLILQLGPSLQGVPPGHYYVDRSIACMPLHSKIFGVASIKPKVEEGDGWLHLIILA
jgi:hypothetical protein